MKNPNRDMLLYIGMADAYAAAYEYVKRDDKLLGELLKFERYHRHPRHRNPPGTYTDDTEMSVANARTLTIGPPFSKQLFIEQWLLEFERGGGRNGYSRGFQTILNSCESVDDFVAKVKPTSEKNGACMRVVPIGVLPTPGVVTEVAEMQASITHNTPPAIFSAKAVALLSHFSLYYDEPMSQSADFVLDHLTEDERKSYGFVFEGNYGGPVYGTPTKPVSITTVQAVYTLLSKPIGLLRMMEVILRWGGDTDTVAALAWGIASARNRKEELPTFFVEMLECGRTWTGASYLDAVGMELMEFYS